MENLKEEEILKLIVEKSGKSKEEIEQLVKLQQLLNLC